MKVLVTYFSQTGNTKKVAEAIYGCVQCDKQISSMGEVSSIQGHDLTFVGFPIHAGQPAADARQFLERHSNGNNLALFITHASPESWAGLEECLGKCREAAAGANILGLFDCQGELSAVIADFMAKSGDPELIEGAKQRASTVGQPDNTKLERARKWAENIISEFPPATARG